MRSGFTRSTIAPRPPRILGTESRFLSSSGPTFQVRSKFDSIRLTMKDSAPRRIWPFVLLAIPILVLYLYTSVEIVPDATRARPVGNAEDIAALSERSDTNILFILVDTLRAERMSSYGYDRETTPFLDNLAQTGIRFDRHISQSSWTKSSMASMWSSLVPLRAGVTTAEDTLSSRIDMPAEILSEAGFKTVGLYRNGWVEGYFGFDQGFERYRRPFGGSRLTEASQLRPNAKSFGTDQNLVDDAIEFLRIHGKTSRWFLYLHFMDLHEYTYDEESAVFGNAVPDIYDNSILRTDWMISTLYDYLAKSDLLSDTVVVLLSDHGEAFGERGFEGHARNVLPETTETPLIISLPFRLESELVVLPPTMNVDVWPTLFDLLGLPGQGEIDGVSRREEILSVARGTGARSPRENDYSIAFLDEAWGRVGTPRKPAISVIDGEHRYVSGSGLAGRPFELLLSTEDHQRRDRLAEQPELAERLRAVAKRQLKAEAAFEAETIELDEMQLDQLRALGYDLP